MPQINQPSPPGTASSGDPGADTQAKVSEAAGQAQATAQHAAGQAREKLKDQISQRSSQAAAQISEQASDLRSVSESLREQGKEGPAKAADRLARYAEKFGGYLHDKDSDALLADAEDFGRRQPWAVAGGGLALGLAASRFLKASSRQRYQSRPGGPRPATPRLASSGQAGNGYSTSTAPPPSLASGVAPGV